MRSVLTLSSVRIELNFKSPGWGSQNWLGWGNTHISGNSCECENKRKYSDYFLDKSAWEGKLVKERSGQDWENGGQMCASEGEWSRGANEAVEVKQEKQRHAPGLAIRRFLTSWELEGQKQTVEGKERWGSRDCNCREVTQEALLVKQEGREQGIAIERNDKYWLEPSWGPR